MNKEKVIFFLFIVVAIFAYTACIKDFINNIMSKLKVKACRESIINLKIERKMYSSGWSYSSGVNHLWARPRLPNSYIVNCRDKKGVNYVINDKEIFDNYEVDDVIELKLFEKLDKNNDVLSYKLKK